LGRRDTIDTDVRFSFLWSGSFREQVPEIPTLAGIIQDMGLTVDEFIALI
jgi:hypothetical protein